MKETTRTKQSIKNSIVSFASYFFKLAISFVARTFFIYILSAEYLGLNSLFSNILNLLSLAELGFGSTIAFAMYGPIAKNDTEKVKSLLDFYKKVYFIVGAVIIAVGLSLIPALPYLIKDAPNVDVDIKIVYVVFVVNSGLSYFFAHRKTLLFAYQRNDIETLINVGSVVLLNILQIILLYFTRNYYVYIILMPICTIVELVITIIVTYKMFPLIKGKCNSLDSEQKKSITKNIYAMSLHKIGSVVLTGTDSLVISSILGLAILGYYSNYLYIAATLIAILGLFSTSVKGSVGNLVSLEDVEHNKQVFFKLNLIMRCSAGLFAVCFFVLIQSFMDIWAPENYEKLSIYLVLLFSTYIYVSGNRGIVQAYRDAKGLFRQNRYAPVVECVLNLGISIGCAFWFGIEGVILGTVISLLLVPFWVEPFIVFKFYFNKGQKKFWVGYFLHTTLTVIAGGLCFVVCYFIPNRGIILWLVEALVCISIVMLIYYLAYFKTKEFKELVELVKNLIKKKNQKNNNESPLNEKNN